MTIDDSRLLAPFDGHMPPAPRWYVEAMAAEPPLRTIMVDGVAVEWRAWGPIGAPGLLLVHGGWAHAGWWSHLAPLLAQGRRVAALSLSGMGGSGWRDHYAIDQYARELRAVARAAALDVAGPPVIAGHSFGCAATALAAADPADWTGGVILIDGTLTMKPGDGPGGTVRRTRAFTTEKEALARFRLMPPQPCDNAYIADGIARRSLKKADDGWIWAFDPALFARCTYADSRAAIMASRRPVLFIRGARSAIVDDATYAGIRSDLPDARFVVIPDAGHHIMLDQPHALADAIDAFCTGLA
jgi:pimeloyl-ACP methyl ester carboxylesterase